MEHGSTSSEQFEYGLEGEFEDEFAEYEFENDNT